MSRRPIDHRQAINARRAEFKDLKWRAATTGPGFILTRERRLLGAIYALTSLDGRTTLLYSLAEVRAYLEQRTTPAP